MSDFLKSLSEFFVMIESSVEIANLSISAAMIVIVEFLASVLFRTFRFTGQRIRSMKVLLKLRTVMKDQDENLYILIRDGKLVSKVTYNSKEQTIAYSDLSMTSDSEKSRVASAADTLAFNFAFSSIKKMTKTGVKKSRVSKEIDLIGKLLKNKAKETNLTYLILIIALSIEILVQYFVPDLQNIFVILFTCIMILLLFVKRLLLQYRVKKGLYGTCYSEAKEILSFISNDKKNNRNGTKESKLIFKDEEIEEVVQKDLYKGEQYVQRN